MEEREREKERDRQTHTDRQTDRDMDRDRQSLPSSLLPFSASLLHCLKLASTL